MCLAFWILIGLFIGFFGMKIAYPYFFN